MALSEEMAQSEEMAAAGLSVTVTHSNEKHDLHVISQQGCSEPTVQDLARVVEEATGVPLPFQKLIFKGKSLKEMEKPLSALGLQNGCRIMLIGKKNSPEEEVELKKLKDLEKSVEKIANQLEELNKELSGIQQGFLATDLQAEALCKLNKRVKATIEQFMKILEEIDTLVEKRGPKAWATWQMCRMVTGSWSHSSPIHRVALPVNRKRTSLLSCPLSWDTISPPAGEYMELRDPKNFLQPHRTRRFLPHVDYLVNDF
ncbi:BAG family molecular chaperone regulator 1 isoform X1 [Desmodus rotundus]|uniref:BAG family molecular chaperone regulator 1 isoform X1 n=1 Tax=Desmodus rotundus TaxID=9430 RepID=UPI0039E7043C